MQRVDPFIPVTTPQTQERPLPGLTNNVPLVRHHANNQSVDGMRKLTRPKTVHIPPHTVQGEKTEMPQQPKANKKVKSHHKTHTKNKRGKRRISPVASLLLYIPFILILGIFLQSPLVGGIVIIIYGLIAFIKRIPSKLTFMLAALGLIGIVVLSSLKQNATMATNFAVYCFLLLAIGAFTMSRESHRKTS